jgi:diadenosine tetraphosphate (Ap4A) HIT family hydrolase
MKSFELDARLAADCITLGKVNGITLLLMNNSRIPWFILVPQTSKTELFELEESERQLLFNTVNELSAFVKKSFDIDKLNVAAIGNIVSQLHIHVVGRSSEDPCWPGVVWGADIPRQQYSAGEVTEIRNNLQSYFPATFVQ